jgi:hypothetical protein
MLEDANFHSVIAQDRTDQVIHFLVNCFEKCTNFFRGYMIIVVYVVSVPGVPGEVVAFNREDQTCFLDT